jgi:hypothetical protein
MSAGERYISGIDNSCLATRTVEQYSEIVAPYIKTMIVEVLNEYHQNLHETKSPRDRQWMFGMTIDSADAVAASTSDLIVRVLLMKGALLPEMIGLRRLRPVVSCIPRSNQDDTSEFVRIQDCREGDPTPRILKVRRTDVRSH